MAVSIQLFSFLFPSSATYISLCQFLQRPTRHHENDIMKNEVGATNFASHSTYTPKHPACSSAIKKRHQKDLWQTDPPRRPTAGTFDKESILHGARLITTVVDCLNILRSCVYIRCFKHVSVATCHRFNNSYHRFYIT